MVLKIQHEKFGGELRYKSDFSAYIYNSSTMQDPVGSSSVQW